MNERPDYLDYRLDGWNLIEAAAGTGKTYTIQNLAVRFLLERRLPIRSLLVVTFTEAAAAFGIPSASVHTVGAFRSAYEQFLGTPGISLIEMALPLRGVRDRYAPYQR